MPIVDTLGLAPSEQELLAYCRQKYTQTGEPIGPSPSLRLRHEFVSSDDYYETMVGKLVKAETRWIDVGCGRDIFPSNYPAAKTLAQRCAYLAGVDPDPNVHENVLLSERFEGTIEQYSTDKKFDLITLRMVAEHVQTPDKAIEKLAELSDRNGLVVIYTPWKWSPMSRVASVVPFAFHNRLKRLIWNSESRDTFPTAYRMNTRLELKRLFEDRGFNEVYFCDVDDCSIFTHYRAVNALEISFRNLALKLGVTYPEHCLFGIYQRR
jgi:hypothetical protein